MSGDGPRRRLRFLRTDTVRRAEWEVEHHLREAVDRLVEEGWEPEAARREAERRFGDRRETVRRLEELDAEGTTKGGGVTMGGETFMRLIHDLRHAARAIRRSPAISTAVTATLAVGIGAALVIFSMIDGVLLHPIPVPEAERVVRVFQALNEESPYAGTAYPTLEDYRAGSPSLEGPVGWTTLDVGLRAGDLTDRVSAGLVTGDYFAVLRVPAERGRTLQPADEEPAAPNVAVLSHGLWERVFGADPEAVGRTVEVSGTAFEVVGVAPEGFRGATLETEHDLWLPLSRIREAASEGLFASPFVLRTRAFAWISMAGRLGPGAGPEAVRAELDGVARALRAELGEDESGISSDAPTTVLPLAESAAVGDRDGLLRFIGLLSGVVLLTLVVACVNAANLVAARAWTRGGEIGVRQALGAGRGRLVRHLMTENLLLGLVGGGAGLALASLATRALRSFSLPGGVALSRLDLGLDARLAAVALALSVGSAVAFGLWPAFTQSRGDVAARLRDGGSRGTGRSRAGATLLTASQVGLSLVLLVGALLFGRTLQAALDTDLGFEAEGVAAVSLAFRGHGYPDAELPSVLDRILDEVESSPAVSSAAFASHVPLAPPATRLSPVPEGTAEDEGGVPSSINTVTPGYFETLGIPLVEGRVLGEGDGPDGDEVAVLNRTAAERFWPGERAIGRTLVLLRGLDPITVVGVVEDHKVHTVADEGVPYVYLPAAQHPGVGVATGTHLVARGTVDAAGALAVLRERLRAFDPSLPVWDARRVGSQMDRVLMRQRFGALLLGLLSGVTLVVSAIGVYGMVSFAVRRRRRELGIRVALGAGPGRVVREAMGRAGSAVLAGVAGGLLLAGLLSRFVEEYLYGVGALDVPAFAAGAALLGGTGVVAALLPALRAARVDPRTAMDPDG